MKSFKRLSQKSEKGSCHCGLDPQSSENQVFFMRLRVKPAIAKQSTWFNDKQSTWFNDKHRPGSMTDF